MKKTLLFSPLLLAFTCFCQDEELFIDEFQLFSGFNNVAYHDDYNLTETVYTLFKPSQPHKWNTTLDPYSVESFFPDLRLPSFHISAIAGHKLPIPNISWRFGLNCTFSSLKLARENQNGSLDHNYVYNDSGQVVSYKTSEEEIDYTMFVHTQKFAIQNDFYFRSGSEDSKRTLYFGVSTQFGLAHSSYEYNYGFYTAEYDYTDSSYSQSFQSSYSFNERTKGQIGPYASLNILIGYDRALSKKKEKLRQMHIFTEFMPGACIFYSPELKSWKSTYNGYWSLMGFRFTFDDDEERSRNTIKRPKE